MMMVMMKMMITTVIMAIVMMVVTGQRGPFTKPLRPWRGIPSRPLGHTDAHFFHREGPGATFSLRTLPPHEQSHPLPHAPPHAPAHATRKPKGRHPGPVSLSAPGGPKIRPNHPPPSPPPPPPRVPSHPLPPHPPSSSSSSSPHPRPFKTRGGGFITSFYEHTEEGPGGCQTIEGFYFAGQTWYTKGCRRRKCIHFKGKFFTETDSCDSEIYNTTYRCVIQVDTTADFPRCCPTYRCNPDNLGNLV